MALVSLKEILSLQEKGAVGAFSTYDLFSAQGIIAGAEKANMPVILMIGSAVLSKPGNEEIGALMVKLAKEAKVPAAVFLDHSKTFELCMKAIQIGFSAVMIDGSYLPFDENVALTKKVVEAAHAVGVSVEAEIGALAGIEDGEAVADAKVTDPKDAAEFARLTNVDALALSIGNAHGLYKGVPHLHYEVLEGTAKLIDTPLVLHGGTGLSKEQFAKCIDLGVKKVNIGTEIKRSFMDTFTKVHMENVEAYDFIGAPQQAKAAVAKTVEENLKFFAQDWKNSLK
ncbi:class II fructose-bisphosphate aldolase [Megamonas hypermegale]|uniref:class II fructose-bisphosphate aldolase n=1 Tax=Megamonas hypermegale TaxID=158847 RepID=UPI0025A38D4C|nr:class II fructose-bisphosphate aldolase [Megamonas hypermegale]MDM8143084.1 class II fructose-bisphosphate aldolase [Megamonas hypermegale]